MITYDSFLWATEFQATPQNLSLAAGFPCLWNSAEFVNLSLLFGKRLWTGRVVKSCIYILLVDVDVRLFFSSPMDASYRLLIKSKKKLTVLILTLVC